MKKIIVLLLINMWHINMFSQENGKETVPKGKWRVSKEYDDQGNMISYDSVYVWSSGNMRDFEFFKNDSLAHHFKGFIRDFEMPKFNFREGDSLEMGVSDFFRGFEFPEMNFRWFENDSIHPQEHMRRFFGNEEIDFEKEIEELKKQIEEMQNNFDEKQKSETVEPKKVKEHKL